MSDIPKTIDEYIHKQPEHAQRILQGIRDTIKKTVPEATETISYGIPTFNLNGHYLVYFGAWSDHIGLYPLPDGGKAHELFAAYAKGKGSVHLPYDEPFPYDLVAKFALIRKEQETHSSSH